jgi:S-adenosylmethionine-diacylglycerol 3-amino-3-carboxypropyl transferase
VIRVADGAFQELFRHLFVYNMLFEDTEVDERFLGVGPTSRVLGISGAGCGIAGHLSRQPQSIDAVDINARHLAITALKTSTARELASYEEFYGLWGHGTHADPRRMASRLTERLPRWVQEHWRANHHVFAERFHRRGLTARLFTLLRHLAKVDAAWLRTLIAQPVGERRRIIFERFEPILRSPSVAALLRSPLHLIAIGVNLAQRDRMLRAERMDDVVDYLLMHLGRVAETDLERNWFAWLAVAGEFNHDHPDAIPPFLRRGHHERSLGAKTTVRFHHKNIFDVLATAGPNTWTHYTLCDAPDWMPDAMQNRLLREILRTSADGAVVLCRSVEEGLLPERHGLDRHFRPMSEATEAATRLDRTRQFRRVGFYEVVH